MPLNSTDLENILKTSLKTALDTEMPLPDPPEEGDDHPNINRTNFCNAVARAIATEVVKHIKDNLVITGATVNIPAEAVITDVVGQATGTPNAQPIECTINFNDDPARLT